MSTEPSVADRPDVTGYPGGEALYRLRHSTAHVLASAVTELFPDVKVAGGPPVATGLALQPSSSMKARTMLFEVEPLVE